MIEWIKPPINDELDCLKNVTTQFTPTHLNGKLIPKKNYNYYWESNFAELKQKYVKSTLLKLTSSMWSLLENTNSNSANTKDMAEAAIRDNKNFEDEISLISISDEVSYGYMLAPVVLVLGNVFVKTRRFYLVSGNSRLIYCKYNNIIPKVVLLYIDL